MDLKDEQWAVIEQHLKTGGEEHFSLAFTYAWMAAVDGFLRGPAYGVINW